MGKVVSVEGYTITVNLAAQPAEPGANGSTSPTGFAMKGSAPPTDSAMKSTTGAPILDQMDVSIRFHTKYYWVLNTEKAIAQHFIPCDCFLLADLII